MAKPKSENRNPKSGVLLLPGRADGKPYDLRERTLQFALRILTFSASIPETIEGAILRRQLVRAGTSIGANVQEGDGALTRKDTRRSFIIAKKEAQETGYWLRIVSAKWNSIDVREDLAEASELTLILGRIISKLAP